MMTTGQPAAIRTDAPETGNRLPLSPLNKKSDRKLHKQQKRRDKFVRKYGTGNENQPTVAAGGVMAPAPLAAAGVAPSLSSNLGSTVPAPTPVPGTILTTPILGTPIVQPGIVGGERVPRLYSPAAVQPPLGMTFYEFSKQLATGVPPSNAQLAALLQHIAQLLENRRMLNSTPLGQKIILDAQRVLESSMLLLQERNRGEHLQDLFFHAKETAKDLATDSTVAKKASELKEVVSADHPNAVEARKLSERLRESVVLLVRSSEFRDIISELATLSERLLRISPAALSDVVEKGKEVLQKGSLSDKDEDDKGNKGKKKTDESGGAGAVSASASAGGGGADAGKQVQIIETKVTIDREGVIAATATPITAMSSGGGGGGASASVSMAGGSSGNKEAAKQHAKHVGREARERIRNILRKLASNPTYQQGVRDLFALLHEMRTHAMKAGAAAKPLKSQVLENDHMQATLHQLKLVLGEFTGGTGILDEFADNVQRLWTLITDDPTLKAWFRDAKNYVLEGFDNPAVFDDDERLKSLYRRGKILLRNVRVHDATQKTMDTGRTILNRLRNDPIITRFTEDINRLTRDLFLDSSGSLSFKADAFTTLKDIMVGMIMDELKYIPVPRIAGSNAEADFEVDNINLTLFDLLPEDIVVKQKNWTDFHPVNIGSAASTTHRSAGYLQLKIKKLPMKIGNIRYSFNKHNSPRMVDHGNAAVDLPRGVSVKVNIKAHYGSKYSSYFTVRKIKVRIPRMKLRFINTEHRFALGFFRPIIQNQMRRRAEEAIEEELWKQIGLLHWRIGNVAHAFVERSGRPDLWPTVMTLQKMVPMPSPDGARLAVSAGVPASYNYDWSEQWPVDNNARSSSGGGNAAATFVRSIF